MAVISGRYRLRRRLRHAEKEANQLVSRYAAVRIDAKEPKVMRCLARGEPPADALHFALHGKYAPGSETDDGLHLIDGKTLIPTRVEGCQLGSSPFVFLNACQVGSGSALLGKDGGMGKAFLVAGARGVIAPLWNVDDEEAAAIALRFYDSVFNGMHPAEFVRRLRESFPVEGEPDTATVLAYQYFGHPQLAITRLQG
jgi:CHAT domain-containing protein